MTVLRQQITYPETRQISLIEHLDNCSKDNNKFTVIPFYKVKKRNDQDTKKTMVAHFITKPEELSHVNIFSDETLLG